MRSWLTRPGDIKEAVSLARKLPLYARLVWALLRDERVPVRNKALLALLAGYIVMPLDIMPDFVPILGQLDDVAVALLVLDTFIKQAPRAVVEEHLARIARREDDLASDLARARSLLGERFVAIRDNLQRTLEKYGTRFRDPGEAATGLRRWWGRQGRS
jgi:uncharacterized membrane protein YkvA (DUF1232 family)